MVVVTLVARVGRLLVEVTQLVRVDDRAHRRDVAVDVDVEHHDGDQLAGGVGRRGAGLAVDAHLAHGPSARRLGGPRPRHQHPGNLGPTVDGVGDGPYPASTVTVEHDVVGQQLLESVQIAVADRGQEAGRQLLTPLP
jgi:hypothetical protein